MQKTARTFILWVTDVKLPKNREIRTGRAGSNSFGQGEGLQTEILVPREDINSNWFKNTIKIK